MHDKLQNTPYKFWCGKMLAKQASDATSLIFILQKLIQKELTKIWHLVIVLEKWKAPDCAPKQPIRFYLLIHVCIMFGGQSLQKDIVGKHEIPLVRLMHWFFDLCKNGEYTREFYVTRIGRNYFYSNKLASLNVLDALRTVYFCYSIHIIID